MAKKLHLKNMLRKETEPHIPVLTKAPEMLARLSVKDGGLAGASQGEPVTWVGNAGYNLEVIYEKGFGEKETRG